MNADWSALLGIPTPEIIRQCKIDADEGAGILWASSPERVLELSAIGALAWEGREGRPSDRRYEWTGFNLLCNAAPTPFAVDGERFASIDSFYEALKLAEGSFERTTCAVASSLEARRLARGRVAADFVHRGKTIRVSSLEHDSLVAVAICAKIDQNPAVQVALAETGTARLILPLTFSPKPGPLGRITPLALMIERWKRAQARM